MEEKSIADVKETVNEVVSEMMSTIEATVSMEVNESIEHAHKTEREETIEVDGSIETTNTKEGEVTMQDGDNKGSPTLIEGDTITQESNEGSTEPVQPTEKEGMTDGKRYIIDPEFQALFGRKPTEEYERLKEAIRDEGFLQPLDVWKEMDILVDGHNRHQIYEELREELGDKLNIEPPKIRRRSFANRDAAKMWIIQNQFNRRNLNSFQRIEVVLQIKEIFVAQAKANKLAGVPLLLGEGGETDEKLAKLAGTSPEIVRRATRILEKADKPEVAEAIEALRIGKPRVTITGVYNKYCVKEESAQSPATASGKSGSKPVPVSDGANKATERSAEGKKVKVKSYRELVSDAIKGLDSLPAPPSHKDHDNCLRQVRNWLRRQGKVNRAIRAREACPAKQVVFVKQTANTEQTTNAEQAAQTISAGAGQITQPQQTTDQVASTQTA
jgi:ParB-like chromosome segregation protein Spo0J